MTRKPATPAPDAGTVTPPDGPGVDNPRDTVGGSEQPTLPGMPGLDFTVGEPTTVGTTRRVEKPFEPAIVAFVSKVHAGCTADKGKTIWYPVETKAPVAVKKEILRYAKSVGWTARFAPTVITDANTSFKVRVTNRSRNNRPQTDTPSGE